MLTRILPIYLFLVFHFISGTLNAQCECENCPADVDANILTVVELEVSGAANEELNINGQRLCKVLIDFDHSAINEVTMNLVAPDGSNITLMWEESLDFGPLDFWDICFLACDDEAEPDPGYSEFFDTDQDWQGNGPFTGSYYPYLGCFEEDLSGPVNGLWTLEI